MSADWTILPLELVSTIALKLETFEDFLKFSTVCKWWNCASSSIKPKWRATPVVPWLLLTENTNENPNCVRKIFNINDNKCYKFNLPETFGKRCWGSAYGWVVMVGRDLSVKLFKPITKAEICFPSLETLPNLPLLHDYGHENKEDYLDWFLSYFLIRLIVLKVSPGDNDEFLIMVVHKDYQRLCFARHEDQSWTSALDKEKNVYIGSGKVVDVVGMDAYVYVLCDNGIIECWNVERFCCPEYFTPEDYFLLGDEMVFKELCSLGKLYLVQSNSDVLMLLRHKEEVSNEDKTDYNYDIVYRTIGFRVYRLNPEENIWEQIEELGDMALFVGGCCTMSVPVPSASGLQPNSIYFTDDENDIRSLVRGLGGHDMGVYDMKCDKVSRFYEGDDTRSDVCPTTWFIPEFNH